MKWEKFNKNWTVTRNGQTKEITLPHDAMIEEKKDPECANGVRTGYYPGGDYTYEKKFRMENAETVYLKFGGIYKDASIYINDVLVKENHYGYSDILVDISGKLITDGENTIRVEVHNSDECNSRWYSGSGIYRSVYVATAGAQYIAAEGVSIETKELEPDLAVLQLEIPLEDKTGESDRVRVETRWYDADGQVVSEKNIPFTFAAEDQPTVASHPEHRGYLRQIIYIRDPEMWDAEHPYLYQCEVTLKKEDQVLDQYRCPYGIRKIQADPYHGLRINGKPVKLRGGCIHHDHGVIGARSFEQSEERRILRLKKAGFNAVRVAHHPAGEDLLNVCDRLGMYVMDESFDMWREAKNPNDFHQYFDTDWETVLERMVSKDRNHPSVILYCVGNEIGEVGTSEGAITNRNLVEKIYSMDDTRIVTNAVNGVSLLMSRLNDVIPLIFTEEELKEREIKLPITDINDALTILLDRTEKMNALDMVTKELEEVCTTVDAMGYNYATGRYIQDHEIDPERLLIGTEIFPSVAASNWKIVEEHPYILGEFTWTAWDYLGETGIGTIRYNCPTEFSVPYPCGLADTGDFDIVGNRKAISYYREVVWHQTNVPFIGVQDPQHFGATLSKTGWAYSDVIPSWTWKGYENQQIHMEIYSDADEIQVFVNDNCICKKELTEKDLYRCDIDTVYVPGKVEVVAYKDGKEYGRNRLETASDDIHLEVTLDKQEISAYKNDIVYVEIQVMDENGILNPDLDVDITVDVYGGGTLLGFGNADPYNLVPFSSNTQKAWKGKALAVVQAGDEPFNLINVKCKADKYETFTIKSIDVNIENDKYGTSNNGLFLKNEK